MVLERIPQTTRRKEIFQKTGICAFYVLTALTLASVKDQYSDNKQKHEQTVLQHLIEGKPYPLSINGDGWEDLVVKQNNKYTVYLGKADGNYEYTILTVEQMKKLEEKLRNRK